MRFSESDSHELQLDITPLIDVVFLLLLFFMVSATFDKYSQMRLQLPDSSVQDSIEKADEVSVEIDASGRFYVNGRSLVNQQIVTLQNALLEVTEGEPDPLITIAADEHARHQSVIDVLSAAKELGFVRITFVTQAK